MHLGYRVVPLTVLVCLHGLTAFAQATDPLASEGGQARRRVEQWRPIADGNVRHASYSDNGETSNLPQPVFGQPAPDRLKPIPLLDGDPQGQDADGPGCESCSEHDCT